MHVIQTQQNLLRDLLNQMHGDALVLMAPDEPQKIFTEHLKDHANVRSIRSFVAEVVEETDDMPAAWM